MRLMNKAMSSGFVLEAVWGQEGREGTESDLCCVWHGVAEWLRFRNSPLSDVRRGGAEIEVRIPGEAYSRVASALQTQLWKSYY